MSPFEMAMAVGFGVPAAFLMWVFVIDIAVMSMKTWRRR